LQTTSISKSMDALVFDEIERVKDANADFQEAYYTYVQQYGKSKIVLSDPINLSNSIDPVVLVIGRNCVVGYNDSQKILQGNQGRMKLQPNVINIIGRRQPQDSKLVVWNSSGATELEDYNSRADTIPSRVHGIIANFDDGKTLFADLGSSAGSILAGQSPDLGGAFVRIYDPGTKEFPAINFERKFLARED
jgi:hypothetical protein